jgi:preprotein translocase subunit SecY
MSHSTEPWIAMLKQWRGSLFLAGAALIVFFVGFRVPLPILPQETITEFQLTYRYSIFALGLTPWVISIVLAELLILILPSKPMAGLTANGHANPFCRPVVAFAIIFALFQGYNLVSFLNESQVYLPGAFRPNLVSAINLATGTAIIILAGYLIQHSGLGMGFWILAAVGDIIGVSSGALEIPTMFAQGSANYRDLAILIFALILIAGALCWLIILRRNSGDDDIKRLLFPLLVAGTLTVPVLTIMQNILPTELLILINYHIWFLFDLVHGLLVIFLVAIYSHGHRLSLPNVLTLAVFVLILILLRSGASAFIPSITLTLLDSTFVAFAGVNIFSRYTESQRQIAMARALHPKKRLQNSDASIAP